MIEKLENYNYSKIYVFTEDENKKIYKRLNSDDVIDVDDYQFKIITSVSQRNIDGKKMHLIQYEDKQLGWIDLEKSIQIFRFPARHYKVIEATFQPNDLNEKMGISKDFIAHFQNKLLNIKSQITYENEIYYSVFIKDKFHGFHKAEYLDPLIEINENINPDTLHENLTLFKLSNLTNEETEPIEIESVKLVSIFYKVRVAKIQINNNLNYWIPVDQLPKLDFPLLEEITRDKTDLYFDDIIHSVNNERMKSKDILKSVLAAKEFVSNKKGESNKSDIRNQLKIEELNEELENSKRNNEDLSNQIDSITKHNKLSMQRLDQQLDYNKRLEEQKDKYKLRMETVEGKLKTLDAKYKELKTKYNNK